MKRSKQISKIRDLQTEYFEILKTKVPAKEAERLQISPEKVETILNTKLFLFYNEPDTNFDEKIDGLSAVVGEINGKYLQIVPPIKYPIKGISASKDTLYTDQQFLEASENDFQSGMGKPFIEGIILRIYLFDGEVYVSNYKNPILQVQHKLSLTNFASSKREEQYNPSSIIQVLEKCFPNYKDALFPRRSEIPYSSIVYNFVLTGSLFPNKNAFITFGLYNLIYIGYSVGFNEDQTALRKGEYDESTFNDEELESFYKVCLDNEFDVSGHSLMINRPFSTADERNQYFFHKNSNPMSIYDNFDPRASFNLPIFNGDSYYRSKNFTIMLNILTGFYPIEGDISYKPISLRIMKKIEVEMNERGEINEDSLLSIFRKRFLYFDFYTGRFEILSKDEQYKAVDNLDVTKFFIPKNYSFPPIGNNQLLDFIQFQINLNIVYFTSKIRFKVKTKENGVELVDLSFAKYQLFKLYNEKIATKSSDGKITSGITSLVYKYYNNAKNLNDNETIMIASIPFRELIANFEKYYQGDMFINKMNERTQRIEYLLERNLILRKIEILLKTKSRIEWEKISKVIKRMVQISRI